MKKNVTLLDMYLNCLCSESAKREQIFVNNNLEEMGKDILNIYNQYGIISVEFSGLSDKYKLNASDLIARMVYYIDFLSTDVEKTLFIKQFETQNARYVYETRKYFYDYCKSVNNDVSKIEYLAKKTNTSKKLIMELSDSYEKNYLIPFQPLPNVIDPKIKTKFLSKYQYIFQQLITTEDKHDILRLMINNDVRIDYFKQKIKEYVEEMMNDEKSNQAFLKSIFDKLSDYEVYLEEKKCGKKLDEKWNDLQKRMEYGVGKLEKSRKIVNLMLEMEKIDIDEFLKNNNLTKEQLLAHLSIIKKCDNELYQKYINRISLEKEKHYNEYLEAIRKMIKEIRYGIILENGRFRRFDMIDYYRYVKSPFEMLINFCSNKISRYELKVLKTFISHNSDNYILTEQGIQKILNDKLETNCERDKMGFPIPGTGNVLSEEEKNKIFDYLRSIDCPITNKTYNIALKRYLNGILEDIPNKSK